MAACGRLPVAVPVLASVPRVLLKLHASLKPGGVLYVRHCLQRDCTTDTDRVHDRQQVRHELVSRSGLNPSAQFARVRDVAGIAEFCSPNPFDC